MLAFDHVWVDEPGCARMLVDGHSGSLEIFVRQRVGAHVGGDFADTIKQLSIVERRFTGSDAVAPELSGLPNQSCRLGERADRDRPVGGGHSPKGVTGDESGSGSQSPSA